MRPQRTLWPVALALVAACATPSTRDRMFEHFLRSDELRGAAIRGDTERARSVAQWMLDQDLTESLPPWSDPYLTAFRDEARTLSEAESADDVAMGTGRLLRACGRCHDAAPSGPDITFADEPPRGADPGSHMVRHFWAVERMGSGLIADAEASWAGGLEALRDMPLDPSDLDVRPGHQREAGEIAVRLHRMAADARSLTDWDDRAEAYGRLIYQCASCHALRNGVTGS